MGRLRGHLSDPRDQSYLSIQDVARRFGITPTTVYRLAQRGALPAFKVGSQWRFSREMLEAWVADRVTTEWLKSDSSSRARHASR